jgi:pyruvate-formate lyase
MERSIRNQFTFKEDDKYFDMSDPSLGAVYNERDYAKNLDNDSQNAYNSYQNPQQQTNNNNEVVHNKANVQVTNHFEDDIPEIEEIQDFESAMPSEVATPAIQIQPILMLLTSSIVILKLKKMKTSLTWDH